MPRGIIINLLSKFYLCCWRLYALSLHLDLRPERRKLIIWKKLKFVSVSLGGEHSAAITEDGSLYMWGRNYSGQLGDGTYKDSNTPVKIMDNVEQVSL